MKLTNGHACIIVIIALITLVSVGSENVDTYNKRVMEITTSK